MEVYSVLHGGHDSIDGTIDHLWEGVEKRNKHSSLRDGNGPSKAPMKFSYLAYLSCHIEKSNNRP